MIEVRELVKRFRAPFRGVVTAVDHLSFSVRPGEVYGLLGENGAGKTTTLRMLATLVRPDEGRVLVDRDEQWAGFRARGRAIRARARIAHGKQMTAAARAIEELTR